MARELVKALGAADFETRLSAIEELTLEPEEARRKLVTILSDVRVDVHARIWSMIGLLMVEGETDDAAMQALIVCVDDATPVVRRSAIDLLGHLKVERAVAKIGEHLDDHEAIDSAWFDDDSTPAQAAQRALLAIGSRSARALLADNDPG